MIIRTSHVSGHRLQAQIADPAADPGAFAQSLFEQTACTNLGGTNTSGELSGGPARIGRVSAMAILPGAGPHSEPKPVTEEK